MKKLRNKQQFKILKVIPRKIFILKKRQPKIKKLEKQSNKPEKMYKGRWIIYHFDVNQNWSLIHGQVNFQSIGPSEERKKQPSTKQKVEEVSERDKTHEKRNSHNSSVNQNIKKPMMILAIEECVTAIT